ncbi:matrix metalloproteinase-25-like isoform X2 [Artemia franciscana]
MAVMKFQGFAGLNQTGTLDPETIKLMNTPRCGVRDFIRPSGRMKSHSPFWTNRSKRYALQGARWRVNDLTYRISRYPSKLKSWTLTSKSPEPLMYGPKLHN